MNVTFERVVCTGWRFAEEWAQSLSSKQLNRFLARYPLGFAAPQIQLEFRVASFKVPGLVHLFGGAVEDENTALRALYPRLYPEGFDVIPPAELEKETALYRRWEDYCRRAEREYRSVAKTVASKIEGEYFLPACVAHNVTVVTSVVNVYNAIPYVFDRFTQEYLKGLRPLFRRLLEDYTPECDTLLGTLYDRYCVYHEEEQEIEGEGEGEGAGEEV